MSGRAVATSKQDSQFCSWCTSMNLNIERLVAYNQLVTATDNFFYLWRQRKGEFEQYYAVVCVVWFLAAMIVVVDVTISLFEG